MVSCCARIPSEGDEPVLLVVGACARPAASPLRRHTLPSVASPTRATRFRIQTLAAMSDARTPGRSLFCFPENDPLLNDRCSASFSSTRQPASTTRRDPGPPASSRADRLRRHVVTLSSGQQHRALNAINARLNRGWCINAIQSATTRAGRNAVSILLQRKRPRSLFDFPR